MQTMRSSARGTKAVLYNELERASVQSTLLFSSGKSFIAMIDRKNILEVAIFQRNRYNEVSVSEDNVNRLALEER